MDANPESLEAEGTALNGDRRRRWRRDAAGNADGIHSVLGGTRWVLAGSDEFLAGFDEFLAGLDYYQNVDGRNHEGD